MEVRKSLEYLNLARERNMNDQEEKHVNLYFIKYLKFL